MATIEVKDAETRALIEGKAVARSDFKYLPEGAEIVSVSAMRCSGPGWASQLLWVYYRHLGKLDYLALQPEQWRRSPELNALFGVAAEVGASLKTHVLSVCSKEKG